MLLTLTQFERIVPYTPYKRLELILPNLNQTMKKYGIVTDLRVTHFLTQLIIESNYFKLIQEPGTGKEYENDAGLGNTSLGDGRRFISRGYIKILGKKAYSEYKEFSKVDIIGYPYYSTIPRVAMDISGWLWDKLGLNALADTDNLEEITKAIKGDYLIIRERQEVLKRTKAVLGIS